MTVCMICGEQIRSEEEIFSRDTEAGPAVAHRQCIAKMKALLDYSEDKLREHEKLGAASSVLRKVGDDWILLRRDMSVTMIILSYLDVQEKATDAKDVYEWLRRNEVKCSNPSEYIKKLKNRGLISVLKSGEARLVQIVPKGRMAIATLEESLKKGDKGETVA